MGLGLGFVTTLLVTNRLGDQYGLFIGAQRFVGLFLVVAQFGLHPLPILVGGIVYAAVTIAIAPRASAERRLLSQVMWHRGKR